MSYLDYYAANAYQMCEYLLRIGRQEHRLQYRRERLLQERAMIDAELKHIARELEICENEKMATQCSLLAEQKNSANGQHSICAK